MFRQRPLVIGVSAAQALSQFDFPLSDGQYIITSREVFSLAINIANRAGSRALIGIHESSQNPRVIYNRRFGLAVWKIACRI
jgi:hypothetical protein